MSTETKKTKEEEYDLCNICCGKTRVKLWVKCPYCKFSCCRTCLKNYLLETKNITPKCIEPSCDKELSFEFIAINTDNDFYNNIYRNHRANILLELEKSLLPGTQHLAQESLRRKKLTKEISSLELQNKELKKQIELNKRKIDELRYGPLVDVKENKEDKEEKTIILAVDKNKQKKLKKMKKKQKRQREPVPRKSFAVRRKKNKKRRTQV